MNETLRIQRLNRLAILDTAAEPLFDSFARLAAQAAARPLAFVSFSDESRVWCKAAIGPVASVAAGMQLPRATAFCEYALHADGFFEVPDALEDARFAANPYVDGSPYVRSYAGVPLVMADGMRVGVLGVAGQRPGLLEPSQREQLRELGAAVVHALAAREREHYLREETGSANFAVNAAYSPIGIFHADATGSVVYTNDKWQRFFGLTLEQSLGTGWARSVHPEDLLQVQAAWLAAVEGRADAELEFRIRASEGMVRWVRVRTKPLLDPGSGAAKFVGAVMDITEAKRLEEELRAKNDLLQLALDASDLAMWQIDLTTGEVYLSESWSQMLGGTRTATRTTAGALAALVAEEDWLRVTAAMKSLQDDPSERYSVEHRVRRLDGDEMWILSEGRVVEQSADGHALRAVGTNRDITVRKRAEARMAEARAAADTANQLKSDFLATVSHEIRTPLNGVLGLARLLLKEQLRPQQAEYGRLILGSAESLLALIDDVLDYSKIEAGRLSVEDCAFDLRAMLEDLHQIHHLRASEKSLFFTTDIADEVPAWVMADPTRLRQVLNNLLGNALKFTQYGSVSLAVRRNAGSTGETLEIAVSDTGIGIAQEHQHLLFSRFSQADASTTRRFGGTGLGLAIARQLAQLMGGDITLQSALGAGSVFSVHIPLRLAQPVVAQASPPPAQEDVIDARILVVEDNATNQVVARGLLSHLGYRSVTVAADGMEALRCWSEGRFDMILMDCQMPVMDGFQATRELRRRGCAVPIVALTANAVQGDRDRCLASGMDDYLTKPIDPAALENMMSRLVAREVAKMMPTPAPAPAEPVYPGEAQVFDLEGTLARFMDDRELLCAATAACLRQSEGILSRLEAALSAGDAKAAAAAAHALKGSTATVGATTVARLAREIEESTVAGDLKSAARAMPALHLAFGHFRHVAGEELDLLPEEAAAPA
ncbi:MAG: ATP-binding protein [Burkholderiaceae bacterium]